MAEWLEPDWVVDMATRTCQRRRLRRPAIELELFRCRHALWPMFAPHHYLSGSLAKTARTLQEGKIDFVQSPGRIVVPAREAVNAVLEFME